jgi:hypothetical protein
VQLAYGKCSVYHSPEQGSFIAQKSSIYHDTRKKAELQRVTEFLTAAMEEAKCLGSPECDGSWLIWCQPLELELRYRLIADVANGVL